MKSLVKTFEREVYSELYFGVGFGFTRIDSVWLIIIPFMVITVSKKEVYK